MGPEVAAFERSVAEYAGASYCVMVNSGSSANLLMIAALRYRRDGLSLRPGAEVIVPAVSWSTTYYPLYQYGLHMRFVDVDLQTLNFDLESLRRAITPETRAILAVNLLGNPNEFAAIKDIVGNRDILLLEDNCEAMGATYAGRQCGTFGLMGSFSAFFSHHISTMEGGMIITDDEELFHILLSLRAHGWTRNLPKLNRVAPKGDDPFEESFRFVLPGYNVRPLEMSGAIGLEQVKKLPGMIQQRRLNALRFQETMREFPWLRTQEELGESSWFGFSMLLGPDAPFSRRELIGRLTQAGIDVRPVVAGNFAKNEVLAHMPHSIAGNLGNADIVDKLGLFIGNHHYPMVREFDLLRNAILTGT
jgi:CDP-6-deoxy-D-xylo-4-hexulose-3-dehydrase